MRDLLGQNSLLGPHLAVGVTGARDSSKGRVRLQQGWGTRGMGEPLWELLQKSI